MGRNVRCLWQWACRASLGWAVTLTLVTSLSSTLSQCGQSRRAGIHPGVVTSRAPKWNCRRSYNFSSLESDSQGSLSRLQVLHSSEALPAKPSTHFRPSQTLRGKAQSPRKNDATHKPFSFREKQTSVPPPGPPLNISDYVHFPLMAMRILREEMKSLPSTGFPILECLVHSGHPVWNLLNALLLWEGAFISEILFCLDQ